MSTPRPIIRKANKVAVVLELAYSVADPREWWQLFVSVQGQEQSRHHTWLCDAQGALSTGSWQDLCTLVNCYMLDAVTARGGIQGSLFDDEFDEDDPAG